MSASVIDKAGYKARNGFPWQPVRCFHLKAAGRSGAHARLKLAGEEDEKETVSRAIGTTVAKLLEGRTDVVVYPGAVRRGKEWEKFEAEHEEGTRIVLAKEYATSMSIAEALLGDKDAAPLVTARGVRKEETLLFDHLGRACRSTPDFASRSGSWYAELKTTKNASPDWFQFEAERMGYHVQMAMERLALRAHGKNPKHAYLIAVDNCKPWNVCVLDVEEDSLAYGEKQLHLWLERIVAWEAAGQWPGYVQAVTPFKIGRPHVELDWDEDDAGDEATP